MGKKIKNILIACEESQVVCKAFREKGHNAFSCDVIECSGGRPEWHIKTDVLPLLDGNCSFTTCDNKTHLIVGKWDMIIAFPPCTRLCSTGQRWLYHGDNEYRKTKKQEQEYAIEFFLKFTKSNCEKIAIENPVGIMSTHYKKPTQIIQPYFFGDPHRKKTCLWLNNLKQLDSTNIVEVGDFKQYIRKNGGIANYSDWYNAKDENGKSLSWNSSECKKIRSKTFQGIANAMADQWG